MTRPTLITRLVALQEPGAFRLTADVLAAFDTYRTAVELRVPDPPPLRHPTDAASAIVDAIGRGKRVDLAAAAADLVEAQNRVAVIEQARHLAAAVCERAAERATTVATAAGERTIVESLQPAYAALLAEAAKQAAVLGGHPLDDAAGWNAPPKVRTARRHLADLADRHRALREARHVCVLLSGHTPVDDVEHLFLTLRRPQVLSPEWRPPALLPRPEVPSDPVAALAWLAITAAPAAPWLPTVAEQDGAWRDLFGEQADARRAGHIAIRAAAGLPV